MTVRKTFGFALVAALTATTGCAAITARPVDGAEPPAHPAGVLQMVWRTTLHEHGLFEPAPEECATGALANGHLVIGSRDSSVVGVAPDTGHIDWVKGVTAASTARPALTARTGRSTSAPTTARSTPSTPASGSIRWTYHGKGAFERAPELGADLVYAASATDRVVALDPGTGKWRWQYEREMPEGFTIHGLRRPAPARQRAAGRFRRRLLRVAGRRQRRGALGALAGHRLRAVRRRRHDARASRQPRLRGLLLGRPLRRRSARRRHQWRLPVEGVGDVSAVDGRLFFVAPRQGLHAADLDGHVIWRQGLTAAGDLTQPMVVGRYLIFSGSRAGLFIVDRGDGRAPRAVQSRPRRLRRPDPRRQAPAPLRPVEQRLPLRPLDLAAS